MEVNIDKELAPELQKIVVALKFKNTEEFINKAIRDKILEIKRKRFFEISSQISKSLQEQGVKEQEMTNKFNKKREE